MIEAAHNRINSQSAVLYSAIGAGAAILVGGLIIVTKPATATPGLCSADEVGLWPVPCKSSRWWVTY